MGKLQPQELSFTETAPYKTSASAICPAPASAVFNVIKDNEGWVKWIGAGVTSVKSTSEPKHGLGSTRSVTFFGIATVKELFIAWEEPTLWAFTGTSFTFTPFTKLVEGFRIEPIDDKSCRITYIMGCDFPFLLRPFGKTITKLFTKAVAPAVERLSKETLKRYKQ